ncbi:hypothetical protein D3C77_791760 [compost metagenome]
MYLGLDEGCAYLFRQTAEPFADFHQGFDDQRLMFRRGRIGHGLGSQAFQPGVLHFPPPPEISA